MLHLNTNFFSIFNLKTSYIVSLSMIALSTLNSGTSTIPDNPIKKNIIETTDHVIVVKNNSVVFDYLQTEDNIESPVHLRVIEQPRFGAVALNEDKTFEYSPLQNLCEANDAFVYQMIVGEQVTEVSVDIEILCESLTFFNGISKDKQAEKLDKFTILGVENYPDNSLYVFDDTGKEIFHKANYSNDWSGTLESSQKHLEQDRMYYYVFKDGGGNYYSGYLQIN